MNLDVRPLQSLAELDDVLAIEQDSFTNPWSREMHESDLAMTDVSRLFVARDARTGRALGFCSVWLVVDELHINNLAVTPACRRQGVASRLIDAVLRDAYRRGAARATLEVRRSNEPALRLYHRWGFLVAGARPGYYSTPDEDALILWRDNLSEFRPLP